MSNTSFGSPVLALAAALSITLVLSPESEHFRCYRLRPVETPARAVVADRHKTRKITRLAVIQKIDKSLFTRKRKTSYHGQTLFTTLIVECHQ